MAKKIKKQELEELQDVIGKLNQVKLRIGDVEVKKHQLLHQAAIIESDELKKIQDSL